jgi:glycosyltransferase involved in cell wall biosynthesis
VRLSRTGLTGARFDTGYYITAMAQVAHLASRKAALRICHVTSGPLSSGAARGAVWLHEGLLDAGCESTLVTDYIGGVASRGVIQMPCAVHPRIEQVARRALEQLPVQCYRKRVKAIFSTGITGRSLNRLPAIQSADVVNLHWICGGMVSLRSLRQLRVPVVWTLRDLWPVTGGCHYPTIHKCERFVSGCGNCPHLASSRTADLSRLVYRTKARSLPHNLAAVGISEWVTEQARCSPLLHGRQVLTIPNCIDTEVFRPFDRTAARELLGLPIDRKFVLAGALSPSEPYKGWPLLIDALGRDSVNFDVLLFGHMRETEASKVPRLFRNFGYVGDDLKLRVLYAAADVYVSAATSEAFGKTIAESLSCGTPAVAFGATGPKDIVSHHETGYLATPFDARSLADGIEWVLSRPGADALRVAARSRAVGHFSKSVAAKAYLELYRSLLEGAQQSSMVCR